jgi:chromosome segregation ATPase
MHLEQQSNSALAERETQYQQKMEEHQTKIDQLQTDLSKALDAQSSKEKDNQMTVQLVKDEYSRQIEQLNTEIEQLKERGEYILVLSSCRS